MNKLRICGLDYLIENDESLRDKDDIIYIPKSKGRPEYYPAAAMWDGVIDIILHTMGYNEEGHHIPANSLTGNLSNHVHKYMRDNWKILKTYYKRDGRRIPPTLGVRICGIDYEVRFSKSKKERDSKNEHGEVCEYSQVIRIWNFKPDSNFLTLIHESVHIIYREAGLAEYATKLTDCRKRKDSLEEFVVYNLSNHVYNFIIDNWRLLSRLYGKKKQGKKD